MSPVALVYLRGTGEERNLIRYVYDIMVHEGTAQRVFMDGTVQTRDAFERDLFRSGSLPFLVLYDGEPCGVSWLNTLEGRSCRGHFALFRKVWGRRTTVSIGRAIFETLLTYRDTSGFLFDVVLGIVPESNPLAWKLAERCGAKRVGVLPHFALCKDRDTTEDAVLLVTTRETLRLVQ